MRKKIAVIFLIMTLIMTSLCKPYETKAVLSPPVVIGGLILLSGVYVACDYLHDPDKYNDLGNTMKDFANDTVENQKKLYEMEKANFEMVMNKAVDAGIGTCLVGPNGVHITAKQLQGQEYPAFDTWKGYKEKESEKPKSSLWDKFKMVTGLADFICKLWPDGKSPLPDGGSSEQRYYTGDDGYIDRETGQLSVSFSSTNSWYDYSSSDKSEWGIKNDKFTVSWTQKIDKNARVCTWVYGGFIYYGRIPTDTWYETFKYRYGCELYRFVYGTSWGSYSYSVNNYSYHKHVWSSSKKEYVDTVDSSLSYSVYGIPYSCHLDENDNPVYRMWDNLSTNIPVFENSTYAQAYMNNGSLEGLINGAPQEGVTPTEAPAPPSSTVSPVSQYVNYFTNTFSPSVMPYHVNYNIVNNWDGNDTTFNINDYTGVTLPTLTPAPDADGNDINITNNLMITQVNILTEINETVTNIYNFFQIDVDYINEELKMDEDENPTGFDDLKNLISEFEAAFPADQVDAVTQELDLFYPKITIKVPKVLDKFLKAGDDNIIIEDGVKKIVLCDFKDYAIYFVRFRKFLEIVLRIGLIFYLLKELTVVFSIA